MNIDKLSGDCPSISFVADRRSLFIVLSGPGGTGKTTLIKRWLASVSDISYVPNVTTRKARQTPSVDESGIYEFVDRQTFRDMVERDLFAQWVNPSSGKYYGTPLQPLLDAIAAKRDLVFDYTPQLFINLRHQFPEQVVGVFIVPPSLDELIKRLNQRGTEHGADLLIKYRMGLQDLGYMGEHGYHVVNDDIETTLKTLESIRIAEHHKIGRAAEIVKRCRAISPRSMQFYYDPLGDRVAGITGS